MAWTPSYRPVSQTAAQVAGQRVKATIAPQLAAQAAYGRQQNYAIQSFAQALMGKLQPVAGEVGADWQKAIGETGALSNASAQFLQNANPTPQVQQLLSSVNAPAEQQAQIGGQLGQTFGGGGALLSYLGGAVPGREMATNMATDQAQAAQYPALAALRGQQDLAGALWQQSTQRAQIEATRPQLYQDALQTIRQNNVQRQQLGMQQQQLGMQKAQAAEGIREFNLGRQPTSFQQAQEKERIREFNVAHKPKPVAPPTPFEIEKQKEVVREFNISHQSEINAQKFLHWYQTVGHRLPADQVNRVGQRFGVFDQPKAVTPSYSPFTTKAGATYVLDKHTGQAKLVANAPPAAPTDRYTVHDTPTGSVRVNTRTGEITPIPGTSPPQKVAVPRLFGSKESGYFELNPDGTKTRLTKPYDPQKPQRPFGSASTGYYVIDPATGQPKQVVAPVVKPTATKPPATKTIGGNVYQWNPDTNRWAPAPGIKPGQATGGKTPTTRSVGGKVYQWDPATKIWSPAPGIKPAAAGAKGVSPATYATSKRMAGDAMDLWYYGDKAKGISGITYQQAIGRAMNQYGLTQKDATDAANDYFAPGEGGRTRVTDKSYFVPRPKPGVQGVG